MPGLLDILRGTFAPELTGAGLLTDFARNRQDFASQRLQGLLSSEWRPWRWEWPVPDMQAEMTPELEARARAGMASAVGDAFGEGISGGALAGVVRRGDGGLLSASAKPKAIELFTGPVKYLDDADDYVYHVTTAPKAKRILASGFDPGAPKTVKGGFYENYSKDKMFFTDKDGLGFWRDRIEEHLEQAMDNPPDLAIVRVKKADIPDLKLDEVGTKDARAKAYYLEK